MLALTSSIRILARANSVRAFTTCEPAIRLKGIFEDYRQKNYSDETPSRFKKELLKAATKSNPSASAVEIDSLNQILVNIGRADECLSEKDLNLLLEEAGINDNHRAIPVDKMLQLI